MKIESALEIISNLLHYEYSIEIEEAKEELRLLRQALRSNGEYIKELNERIDELEGLKK